MLARTCEIHLYIARHFIRFLLLCQDWNFYFIISFYHDKLFSTMSWSESHWMFDYSEPNDEKSLLHASSYNVGTLLKIPVLLRLQMNTKINVFKYIEDKNFLKIISKIYPPDREWLKSWYRLPVNCIIWGKANDAKSGLLSCFKCSTIRYEIHWQLVSALGS